MTGPIRGSRIGSLLCVLALAIGLAVVWAPVARATGDSAAMEPRIGRDECRAQVPNCVTKISSVATVPRRQMQTVRLTCPKNSYFWNWSATVGPHVQITMPDLESDQNGHTTGATFLIHVVSGRPATAKAQIYLGCSATPAAGKLKERRAGYGWHPHAPPPT